MINNTKFGILQKYHRHLFGVVLEVGIVSEYALSD